MADKEFDLCEWVKNQNTLAVSECWLHKANLETLRQLDQEGKIL